MEFTEMFPIFKKLSPAQQQLIESSKIERTAKKGTIIHNGSIECTGLLLVRSGQLRAYFLSDEGREITLYRLFDYDICMLSAACIMQSIQFGVIIVAEKDSEICIIPPYIYKSVMEQSAALANYTCELMASRLSEVIWLMEQIMWKSLDKRLAAFLLGEAVLEGTSCLKITHESIANHMGSAREVITRMLRYFQGEGMVRLTRGTVELIDEKKLRVLSDGQK